jgi:hypothetical protein
MRCEELMEDRIAVLYGEADEPARRRVHEHLDGCGECREELQAFRNLRRELPAWKVPASLQPQRRWRQPAAWASGWALPAAAVVLVSLGATLLLGGVELRRDQSGWALRIGGAERAEFERLLHAQEARFQADLAAMRASLASAPAARPAALANSDDALLERMRELVRASEQRQSMTLRASLAEAGERAELQRRYDLARIRAGLSYLDGQSGQHMARTSELMGYVLEASQKR